MIMDEKRSRAKRKSMNAEEGYWDCSVCTFRNSPEAFKCEICEFRKGTSTRSGRKPRINPAVVMQQVGQQVFTPPLKKEKKEGMKKDGPLRKGEGEPSSILSKEPSTSKDSVKEVTKENSPKSATNKKQRAPRLKNIDRSSGRSMEVTVNNVTVVITDYQPKKPSDKPLQSTSSSTASLSPSSTASNSTTSTNPSSKPPPPPPSSDDKAKSETVVNGNAATRDES